MIFKLNNRFTKNHGELTSLSYLDSILQIINGMPACLVYVSLGISAYVENIFPPVPGDMITAFGAFLVGTGRLGFTGVYLSTTLGSLLGFITLFSLGAYLGRKYFLEEDHWFFRKKAIIRAEVWFKRYGYFIISLNRFLPGIRSVISIAGGISGLNIYRVAILAFLSSAVWNIIWISVGYTLGDNWEIVKPRLSVLFLKYNLTITILAIAFILILIGRTLFFKAK